MATSIYKSSFMKLVDGEEIYLTPLKIKYLRQFMDEFKEIKNAKNDSDSLEVLIRCVQIAMKQYYPQIKTIEDVEDNLTVEMIYKIVEYAADVTIKEKENKDDQTTETKKENESSGGWDDLDLVELESEVFMIGIWKDYEELESCLSMPELIAILNQKRESEYNDKKFAAAMQGVDLDEQTGKKNAWEEMKARVFSGGATSDSNDIVSYQGAIAQKAGFGIGMGLTYEKV